MFECVKKTDKDLLNMCMFECVKKTDKDLLNMVEKI